MKKTLKVKAVGEALVQDYQAMQGGVRRYIGRKHNPKLGECGGWESTYEEVELPNIAEYRHEVKVGNLEALDEETARLCGVKLITYHLV